MTSTEGPVGNDEFVLRRIHRNHCTSGLPTAVHLAAFRPNREDTSGLSVFREKYVSAPQVAASGRRAGEYYVARLSVQSLHGLGLTVVAARDPGAPPGHAVIPELRLSEYDRDKQRLKDVLIALARLASQALIYQPE